MRGETVTMIVSVRGGCLLCGAGCVGSPSAFESEVRDAGSPPSPPAVAIIVGALSLVLITGVANAREVQLAGMRLGQHAINLLDVYGQPMGIATGQGEEFAAGGAGAAMGMGMGMEGAMPGMEGAMMGMPGMDPAMMVMPGAEAMPPEPGMAPA